MSGNANDISRRGFVKKSLAVGGTVAAVVIAGETAAEAAGVSGKATQHWDKEADVVVVGYGGAGAVSAITASEDGASVIILEKAPEPGGDTSHASGSIRTSSDREKFEQYMIASGQGEISPEMAKDWAGASAEIEGWLRSHGAEVRVSKGYAKFKGVFPNAETPDTIVRIIRSDKSYGAGKDLFEFLAGVVKKSKNIEVMLETPVKRLIQDPTTKNILGVIAKTGRRNIRIRARKGVILSIGGFTANRQMLADYIQPAPIPIYPAGNPYNTGDGIKMVLEVGADLWRMNSIEWAPFAIKPAEVPYPYWLGPRAGSYIIVNKEGNRFLDESTSYSHVRKPLEVFNFDEKRNIWPNYPWFLVFDERVRKAGPVTLSDRGASRAWSSDNILEIEKGWIKRCDTVEELAKAVGIDPAGLRRQIDSYNGACAKGKDEAFSRRSPLVALDQPPFYCLELVVCAINTPGGARKNNKGQVLNPFGEAIPKLYAAGEFGSIWGFFYPGGTYLSECFVSGLLAGRAITAKS